MDLYFNTLTNRESRRTYRNLKHLFRDCFIPLTAQHPNAVFNYESIPDFTYYISDFCTLSVFHATCETLLREYKNPESLTEELPYNQQMFSYSINFESQIINCLMRF